MVLGKALGGGVLPIAACIARDALNVAGDFALGHTRTRRTRSAAAALATQVIERDDLVAQAARVGARGWRGCRDMQQRHRLIGDDAAAACCWASSWWPTATLGRRRRAPPPSACCKIVALSRGLSFKTTMGAC